MQLTHKEKAQQLFGIQKQAEYCEFVPMQSCVKEALALSKIEGVHAMHDATEGGFVTALNELAETSNTGFRMNRENIPIPNEAILLQKHLELSETQMLSFSSTGTILAAVAPNAKQKVTEVLQKLGLAAAFIGEFTETKERIMLQNNTQIVFPSQADDPYTALLITPLKRLIQRKH